MESWFIEPLFSLFASAPASSWTPRFSRVFPPILEPAALDGFWPDAEEDAPAVRLEELLDNMKIDDGTEDQEFDFDAEGQPGSKNQEEAKKHD